MGIEIKVKNNFFEKYPEEIEDKIAAAIVKGCLAVEADAKRNAPVRTGNLRASITTNIISPYEGEVGTNVEYAPYLEYGTIHIAARPFLYPALKSNEEKIINEIRKAIGGKS